MIFDFGAIFELDAIRMFSNNVTSFESMKKD
jgi:hypothetical protein